MKMNKCEKEEQKLGEARLLHPFQCAVSCLSNKTHVSLRVHAGVLSTRFCRHHLILEKSPPFERLEHYYVCSHHNGHWPCGHKAQPILKQHFMMLCLNFNSLSAHVGWAANLFYWWIFFSQLSHSDGSAELFIRRSQHDKRRAAITQELAKSEPNRTERALMATFTDLSEFLVEYILSN